MEINATCPSELATVCRCCNNLPLEVLERQIIGLGTKCEKELRKRFTLDDVKGKELDPDRWFAFAAIFAEPNKDLVFFVNPTTEKLVHTAMLETLQRIASTITQFNGKKDKLTLEDISFDFIRDCFSVSRNCNEQLGELIRSSMKDLGFNHFVNLASGNYCRGSALLDYDEKLGQVIGTMSVRRIVSEAFNKLAPKPYHEKTLWKFHVKHARFILEMVVKYYPPDRYTLTPAFEKALALADNWVEPVFQPFTMTESKVFEVTFETKKNNEYLYPFVKLNKGTKAESVWQHIYDKATKELRASYYKEKSTQNVRDAVNAQVTFLMSEETYIIFKAWIQSDILPLLEKMKK